MPPTRRRFLTSTLTAGGAVIAGCLGDGGGIGDGPSGMGAFFTLKDWGNQVGADVLEFDAPVPVGEMGHGWEPGADIVPRVAQHEVFLYLHTPEFQWAISVAEEIDADETIETAVIDAMQAVSPVDLLPFISGDEEVLPPPDRDFAVDPGTFTVATFDLVHGDEVAAWWHDDHWHGGAPDVPLGGQVAVETHVADDRGRVPPIGPDEAVRVEARIASGAPAEPIGIEVHEGTVEIHGEAIGQTMVFFEIYAGDRVVLSTADDPLVVSVVEPEAVAVDAFHDPHVWVDPVHAQSIVRHIAGALAERYPDEADRFDAQAEAYIERLDGVDRQLQDVMDRAQLDVAVLVAHDAFQYLESRYGFELRTPVGVSPDAAETIEDIARLAETIEANGIDTILFDPFDAPTDGLPQAAELLLEETRAADALPLSPLEGTTTEWRERGYGWIEQMEEVNIPALERALKAR